MAELTAVWTDVIAKHIDAIAEAIRGFENRIDIGPGRRLELACVLIHGDGSGQVNVMMAAFDSMQTSEERQIAVFMPYEKQIEGLNSRELAKILLRDTVRSQHPEVVHEQA